MSDSPKKKPKQTEQSENLDVKENSLELTDQEQEQPFDATDTDQVLEKLTKQQKKKAKANKNKLLVLALGLLIGIAVVGYIYFSQSSEPEAPPVAEAPTETIQLSETSTVPAEESTQPPATTETTPPATDTLPMVQAKVLVDESILKEPVAEDSTLQQEEIDKLNEIEKQLEEQKSNLEAQSQDVDELIRLKEAQIKALEAELAKQK